MIAYNHYIEFNSLLKKDKKVFGLNKETIRVYEASLDREPIIHSKKLKFFNNQGREVSLYTDREFTVTQNGQMWAFEVEGVVTIYWQSGSFVLEYNKHENFSESLLEYWVVHAALPFFFTIEAKYDFLHAGAVEVDEKPVLFTAESFGGKSTMTDYFMQKGHPMISDDKVGTYIKEKKVYAVPSHPHHRPYRKMEDLGYFVENMANEPKPIHAIYQLERVKGDARIEISELWGIEKFKALRYSSEINLPFLKEKRFAYLSSLANLLPVYRVSVPWDLNRLEEVYNAICGHSRTL